MRTLMVAAAIASMASAADAQRVSQRGPVMARPAPRPMAHAPMGHPAPTPPKPAPGGWQRPGGNWQGGHNAGHGGGFVRPQPGKPGWNGHGARPPRWGSHMQGRWWAGWRAPGGWGAYRRPVRGFVLPSFWISPSWYVNDWAGYGLATPPAGYTWSRYYDDAVLIDGRGSVYDTVSGVDWDGAFSDQGYAAEEGYAEGGYDGGAYAAPGAPYAYPQGYYERPDNGVGGAAIGAVVGGVAGNAVAGRGNRLGGTLIGAGVGAAAGYAIDKAEDRGRVPPPAYAPPPPAYAQRAPMAPPVTVQSGGYYANGYYYPGATVTTVTVTTTPVVTTTTEVFEDTVTYTKPVVRKTVRKWRPKPTCVCR